MLLTDGAVAFVHTPATQDLLVSWERRRGRPSVQARATSATIIPFNSILYHLCAESTATRPITIIIIIIIIIIMSKVKQCSNNNNNNRPKQNNNKPSQALMLIINWVQVAA
jgi:hypothetical protein